jgi:hypothetical protein
MLSPVDRVGVDRGSALKGGLPRRDRYEDRRHRKNNRKPKSETIWCPGHLVPPGTIEVGRGIVRVKPEELCELLHIQHPSFIYGSNKGRLFRHRFAAPIYTAPSGNNPH